MNRIELEERPLKYFELGMLASVLETSSDYLIGLEVREEVTAYNIM